MTDAQIRHRLATDDARVQLGDIGTHHLQRCDDACPGRVHADIGDGHVRVRHDRACDQPEGGRRGITRHDDILRFQLGLPPNRDDPALRRGSDGQIRAEARQHPLAMVAGRDRLDHGGFTRRVQARQQDRRLHLRRGDGQGVADRNRRADAPDHQGQAAARRILELRAHLGQRFDDAAHRALGQRGVADKGRSDRVTGDEAHQKARRGARIAHVERGFGLEQPADADAVDHPHPVILPDDVRAHRAHRGGGGEHVLTLQQPFDAAFTDRERGEHQRAVADRFVARNGDGAAKGGGGSHGARLGKGMRHDGAGF